MTKICKAIIPIGYIGINSSENTSILSNEMLHILDKPLIQYVIDEAQEAGIKEFIFVTGQNKLAVEEYLDHSFSKYNKLESTPKITFIRQPDLQNSDPEQNLANAILLARNIISNEPFALLLPQIIIQSQTPCLTQLINAQKNGNDFSNCIIGIKEVENKIANQHQIIAHNINGNNQYKVTKLASKNSEEKLQSNLKIAGRYILPPEIFEIIFKQKSNKNSKPNLMKAMQKLLSTMPIVAVRFNGTSFDCQTKAGYITANLSFAIECEDIKEELIDEFIRTKLRLRIDNLLDKNAIIEMARILKATTNR